MKLNGSIPNINLGLSASVIGLLIFTIVVGGYYVAETKTVSEKNNRDIDILGKNQDVFVKTWLEKQAAQNKIGNETESQLLNLSRTNDIIIKQQLENEKQILVGNDHILGNLTEHRHVANYTRDLVNATTQQMVKNQQEIIKLLNNTSNMTK